MLYNLNPRYPSLCNNFAIVLYSKGENGKAEKLFKEDE